MKLLESAKDLKTSCYIYFLIGNESSTYITNFRIYIQYTDITIERLRDFISERIPILYIVFLILSTYLNI